MLIVQLRTAQPELDPRISRFASTFTRNGWKSVIVCWQRGSIISRKESSEVTKVFSTPNSLITPPFWAMPILLAAFYLRAILVILKLRPDICVSHQLDVLPLALLLRAISVCSKVVFDNEDIYSLMISKNAPGLFSSTIRSLEWHFIKKADLCLFPNSAMKDYVYMASGPDAIFVPNVPDTGFQPEGGKSSAGKKVGDDKSFKITYFGLITRFRGLEVLVGALRELIAHGINASCLLIGDGPLVSELKELSIKYGIRDRVLFTGRVERESIPRLVAACDASAILNSRNDPMNVFGDPNKLYESMVLGIPVIASNFGEIGKIVKESECGVLVDPDDEKSITDAMIRLSRDPNLREGLARNGRETMRTKYSWEEVEHRLAEAMKQLEVSRQIHG